MSRMIGSLAVLATVTALLALAPAASAKGCRVGDERSYGTTYVLSISVSDTSCRSGRKVIRAFHECRPGKSGKCGSRVRGTPVRRAASTRAHVIRLARDVHQGRPSSTAKPYTNSLAAKVAAHLRSTASARQLRALA